MAIFPEDAEGADEILALLEHPWRSFHSLALAVQVPLAIFLIIYGPLAFLLGLLWQIL